MAFELEAVFVGLDPFDDGVVVEVEPALIAQVRQRFLRVARARR